VGVTEGVSKTPGAAGRGDEGVGVIGQPGVEVPCGVIGAVSRAIGVAVIGRVDVGARLGIALGEARRNGVALCAIVADGPGI
jgi:hypothetical protein